MKTRLLRVILVISLSYISITQLQARPNDVVEPGSTVYDFMYDNGVAISRDINKAIITYVNPDPEGSVEGPSVTVSYQQRLARMDEGLFPFLEVQISMAKNKKNVTVHYYIALTIDRVTRQTVGTVKRLNVTNKDMTSGINYNKLQILNETMFIYDESSKKAEEVIFLNNILQYRNKN